MFKKMMQRMAVLAASHVVAADFQKGFGGALVSSALYSLRGGS
jgi:hypothetical protein